MQEQRKLAAIMFTDIVGYTALMSRDEENAHQILHKSRNIITKTISKYGGILLDTIGDGTLTSFDSAVDASKSALEIQRILANEPEIILRIGIHIGDVVFEDNDIYGDGVNVASRLEPLAEPGGIIISDQVYRNIRNKRGIEAIFLGEKNLKNVDLPMKIYALTGEGISSPQTELISAEESGLGRALGKAISHYRVIDKLGEGGMGVVYKAEDTKLKRTVALKFLRSDVLANQEQITRFINEAKSGAALEHVNICTVHEIGNSEGHTYIAMAYVDGLNIKQKILSGGPLQLADSLDLAIQICDGLKEAHDQGIVHRDIKSANIMVNAKGQAKITDFGLAKIEDGQQITREGITVGTLAYMSPEQARGEQLDHRTDIWSLGIIVYEMLTGYLPFSGDNQQALYYSISNTKPKPIKHLHKGGYGALERIVYKALKKDPRERYQSVSAIQADLLEVSEKASSRKKVSLILRVTKNLKFNIKAVFAAAMVLLAAVSWPIMDGWKLIHTIPDQKHIVVLPFKNVGDDPGNQAFCEGMVQTMTSKLSEIERFQGALWVVPAVDVLGNDVTSAGAARQMFDVNLAVAGSMQRIDAGFRLTLSLIDTETLRQLSSAVITDRMTNVAVLQDGIVEKLAKMLDMEINPEARRILAAGKTNVPGAYEFYLQGRGYLQNYGQSHNIEQSIELFKNAIKLDPSYALAYAGLGEAYWRKYDNTKDRQWVAPATDNCERAVQLSDLIAPAHVALGVIYNGTGRYDEAIGEFQRALELNPTSDDAYREMAKAYSDKGRVLEAELTYLKAIEINPSYWSGYNNLGVFYFEQARLDDAIKQFRSVVSLNPLNARGYSNLGGILVYNQKWDEAEEMFLRSLELEPDYVGYSNLATMYFHQQRYAEAVRMFEKALELGNTDYRMWANLASACYWTVSDQDRSWIIYRHAISMAEKQLEVNPSDPEVLIDLAVYYAMIKDRQKAFNYLQQVIDMGPEISWVNFAVGHAYEILGEREQALIWIEKAIKKGYSREEVDQMPIFEDFRNDSRYHSIVSHLK